ncbi:unnamed protein product [Oikopleura dioica]|uniref:Uncharacterized protein n=1 Tax=Oikopleura dioica TaxID=34765 RepID=E4YBZ9_OIKDI|nr:unnamed protein product [Oikopleura dioica]
MRVSKLFSIQRKSQKSIFVNLIVFFMLQNILFNFADASILNRRNLRRGLSNEIRIFTSNPNDAAQNSGIQRLPKNFENQRDKEDRNRLRKLASRRYPSRKIQSKLPHEDRPEKNRKRSTKSRSNGKQRRLRSFRKN